MRTITGICAACKGKLELSPPVGRNEECPHCGVDVRACRHCRFYDTSAPYNCRESMAEPPRDAERANFCEWFVFVGGQDNGGATADELRSAAEALFKKK